MRQQTLKRSFFQRLFGKCATKNPQDETCWTYLDGKIMVDLDRAPELSKPGGAVRLEGLELPERILVFLGDDGDYHAFRNRCGHAGRRLDPVPGAGVIQCCSLGKSTYDYEGLVLRSPAQQTVAVYQVTAEDAKLIIAIQ